MNEGKRMINARFFRQSKVHSSLVLVIIFTSGQSYTLPVRKNARVTAHKIVSRKKEVNQETAPTLHVHQTNKKDRFARRKKIIASLAARKSWIIPVPTIAPVPAPIEEVGKGKKPLGKTSPAQLLLTKTTMPAQQQIVPSNPAQKKSKPQHYDKETTTFQLGVTHGKRLLKMIVAGPQKQVNFSDIETNDSSLTTLREKLTSLAFASDTYKKAYASLQEYYRGLESALSSYVPAPETSISNTRKNFGVTLQKAIISAYTSSSNHKEAEQILKQKMAELAEKIERFTPSEAVEEPVIIDTNHLFYKEGYRVAQHECAIMVRQAQGNPIRAEEKAVFQKQLLAFFSHHQKPSSGSHERHLNLAHYLAGMKRVYDSFNLDAVFAEHTTPAETASQIRAYYAQEQTIINKAFSTINSSK